MTDAEMVEEMAERAVMVERVAKALHAHETRWLPRWLECTDWQKLDEPSRERYREAARVCVKAVLGGDVNAETIQRG